MIPKTTVSKSKIAVSKPKKTLAKFKFIYQFKALFPTLLKIYLPLICIFLIIGFQNRIPIGNFTKDPLALLGKPFYFGIISQVGALVWCSCAAICFFCGALLAAEINQKKLSSFYYFSGAITTLLLIDDMFLVHEIVLPKYLNIPEKLVFLIYAILVISYLLKFKKTIQNTEFLTLILAFAFFGFSIIMDISLIPIPKSWLENEYQYLLEDGAKLLGIISWYTYFIRGSLSQLKQVIWNQQAQQDLH